MSKSVSFSTLYFDESLHGHLFLKPSIFVGNAFQWIFSDIEDSGFARVVTLTSRIALFLVLPLIALLSILLIPIGLVCKACSSCCTPTLPQKSQRPPPHTGIHHIVKKPITQLVSSSSNSSSFEEKITLSESSSSTEESEELKGEVAVADNGDCLFEAFVVHMRKEDKQTPLQQKVKEERKATVAWITKNYSTDKELQTHLIQSITEHYMNKLEDLKNEKASLQKSLFNLSTLGFTDQDAEDSIRRSEEIVQEIAVIESEISPRIAQAAGKAHSTVLHFDKIEPIATQYYLPEIAQQGVYGGAAELFALSCRHKKCVMLHWKRLTIEETPFQTINPQFATKENPALHFTKTTNHYNPYFIVDSN